jgi:hypothetical protein
MLKMSRNSLGEYNKSCSALHQKSSKIEFAIFRIFYDFLGILQFQQNLFTAEVTLCTGAPRKIQNLTKTPLVHGKYPRTN